MNALEQMSALVRAADAIDPDGTFYFVQNGDAAKRRLDGCIVLHKDLSRVVEFA